MNISMFTAYGIEQVLNGSFKTPQEAFRYMFDLGIHYGDIADTELSCYPLHLYCDILKDSGITPSCFIATADTMAFDKEARVRNTVLIKGYVDQMEKLGIPLLMIAPMGTRLPRCKEEKAASREWLIEACGDIIDYAEGSGITVAVENQSFLARGDSSMRDLRYILDSVPKLRYIFDVGNFFCIQEDAFEAYELLQDRLAHVHFKDWCIDEYGTFTRENLPRFEGTVLGSGEVPLHDAMKKLKRNSYDGNIVLEINSQPITLQQLTKSAEFLRSEIYV
jgi:sugar phosphate isomerase/epimerase